jgi:hypothetical protein
MKSLLTRFRRLWALLGCQHENPHCFHIQSQTNDGGRGREVVHVHFCASCWSCVHFEVLPGLNGSPAQLGRFTPPPLGDHRWN